MLAVFARSAEAEDQTSHGGQNVHAKRFAVARADGQDGNFVSSRSVGRSNHHLDFLALPPVGLRPSGHPSLTDLPSLDDSAARSLARSLGRREANK